MLVFFIFFKLSAVYFLERSKQGNPSRSGGMGVTEAQGIADVCEHVLSETAEIPGDVLTDKHMTHAVTCDMRSCDKTKIIIKTNERQMLCDVIQDRGRPAGGGGGSTGAVQMQDLS